VLATCLDNQVLIYETQPRFKLNKKKRFIGHKTAGYALETAVSPDGRWVASGDAQGGLFFWGWGTARVARKFAGAHDGVVATTDWGCGGTVVATGGWDGAIKLWA
jgi:pre-mRNA-processing factor 17